MTAAEFRQRLAAGQLHPGDAIDPLLAALAESEREVDFWRQSAVCDEAAHTVLIAELAEAKQLAADRDNEIEALHARLGEPYQSGRVSQLRADLIGLRRTNELLTRETIKQAGRIKQLEGGDLVAALMTDVAVRDARMAKLELVRDVAAGILGADDDDRVSEIRVHFSDRPSMYLRNALAMALDDAERP